MKRFSFLLVLVFFLSYFVFSKKGIAFTSDESRLSSIQHNSYSSKENSLSHEELERQTEELKNKLLLEDEQIKKELNDKGIKIINYKVKEGDTLNGISARYQVPVRFILAENKISENTLLKVGINLRIPKKPGIIYSLRKGDRLINIAEKYQVKIEDIILDNDLEDYDIIKSGTKIFLPNAIIPEPPPVWQYPVLGRITSRYGMRLHPLFGYRQFHGGIDFAVNYSSVKAAREGVVYYAGQMGGYGLTIILKHGNDFKTLYAHLSKIYVKTGQYVKAGTKIGVSGNTGFSTGPHLHFEVIYKGKPVNPFIYLK